MAAADLKNTLNGMDVVAGDEELANLPPEAQAIIQALGQISSAPTPEETAAAQAQAASAFGPLMPGPAAQQPLPPQASDLGSFLTLLASNIAGTVNPEFGKAGPAALADQRRQRDAMMELNASTEKERSEQALKISIAMTEAALKQAQNAGDDRAAAQKATQLARLNDILGRRATTQRIAEQGEQNRLTGASLVQQRSAAQLKLKQDIKKALDESGLPEAAKVRLRANEGFLGTALSRATQVDPMTGQAPFSIDVALKAAQEQFDGLLQEELQKAGLVDSTKAAPAKKSDSLNIR